MRLVDAVHLVMKPKWRLLEEDKLRSVGHLPMTPMI